MIESGGVKPNQERIESMRVSMLRESSDIFLWGNFKFMRPKVARNASKSIIL